MKAWLNKQSSGVPGTVEGLIPSVFGGEGNYDVSCGLGGPRTCNFEVSTLMDSLCCESEISSINFVRLVRELLGVYRI